MMPQRESDPRVRVRQLLDEAMPTPCTGPSPVTVTVHGDRNIVVVRSKGIAMKLICAWCEKTGVPAEMGKVPGPADEVAHGLCPRHRADLEDELDREERRRIHALEEVVKALQVEMEEVRRDIHCLRQRVDP